MRKLGLTSAAIACCALLAGHVAAQSDKVPIRIVPQPNQTTRLTLTQEGDVDITPEGGIPGSPAATQTMKMTIKSTIGVVLKNGPADSQGRIVAELTYEDARFEMAVNGNTIPFGEAAKTVIGKKFTITFDREGEILDVNAPGDLTDMTKSFKQIQQLMYGNVPKGELSIGETVVIPQAMDVPLPLPGAGPLKTQGDVKSKLVAIVNEADGRIAKFDYTSETKVANTTEVNSASGNATMSIDVKMSGNGTSQFNLTKGLLKTSEMKMNLDGKISASDPTTNLQTSNMTVKGTMKVSASSTN
jgi:hypothetical protein